MSDVKADKRKSAAVPDDEFDRLTAAEKRAWLAQYLQEGRQQIVDGASISLHTDEEIKALFNTIRKEAHERAGFIKPRSK